MSFLFLIYISHSCRVVLFSEGTSGPLLTCFVLLLLFFLMKFPIKKEINIHVVIFDAPISYSGGFLQKRLGISKNWNLAGPR